MPEIEKELAAAGIDVETELKKQIEDYNELLNGANTQAEKDQIQSMINSSQTQLDIYLSYKNPPDDGSLNKPFGDKATSADEIFIPMALAFFAAKGNDLSYELLSHARDNIGPNTTYQPVYGKRVLSSLTTYDILVNPKIEDDTAFPSGTGGTYEQDLYLAIHGFHYKKLDNNGTLRITDPYNFDSRDHGPIIDYFIEKFDRMMQAGILTEYTLDFTINVYDYLYISTMYKVDNKWKINVTNYTNSPLDVMYNSKMCTNGNAKYWTNLDNLKVFTMPARTSTVVEIEEQGPACYVTFSHIKNNTRYISYANELLETNPYGSGYTESGIPIPRGYLNRSGNTIAHYGTSEDLSVLSRIGPYDNWIVKIANPFNAKATVNYNSKMCFQSDGARWKNLKDIQSFQLDPGSCYYVVIYANYLATSVAARITTNEDDRILCADELDKYCCHMNLQRFSFLKITNCGKSSGWQIDIHNPTKEKITVDYNSKLCFEADAEDWKNLHDVATIELQPYETRRVVIKTNLFARTIAISYNCFGRRVITYAYDLDNGNNMTVKHKCI